MAKKKARAERVTNKPVTKPKTTTASTNQPVAERRAADAELSRLVEKFASDHQRLITALRRSLRKRMPTACELVYEYRDCFVISYSPNDHGYEGLFAIRGSESGVKLYPIAARSWLILRSC